ALGSVRPVPRAACPNRGVSQPRVRAAPPADRTRVPILARRGRRAPEAENGFPVPLLRCLPVMLSAEGPPAAEAGPVRHRFRPGQADAPGDIGRLVIEGTPRTGTA